jgi:hypothetical protein
MSLRFYLPICLLLGMICCAKAEPIPTRTIKLRVSDNFTHLPIQGAEIFLEEIFTTQTNRLRKIGRSADGFFNLELTNNPIAVQYEINAGNYGSFRSPRLFPAKAQSFYDIPLERLFDFEGFAVAPTGQRASGAHCFLCTDVTEVTFRPDRTFFTRSRSPIGSTSRGHFILPPESTAHSILIAHDLGYACVPLQGWTNGTEILLRPWARVTGKMLLNGAIPAPTRLQLRAGENALGRTHMTLLNFETTTDAQGRFLFDNVPPTEITLGWMAQIADRGFRFSSPFRFVADPAKNLDFVYDAQARNLTGKLFYASANSMDWNSYHFNAFLSTARQEPLDLWQPNASSQSGLVTYELTLNPDLALNGVAIPPGEYTVKLFGNKKADPTEPLAAPADQFILLQGRLSVPAGPVDANLGLIVVTNAPLPVKR